MPDTEIELWPEKGESEGDFMDRCVVELEVCIGDRAEDVCQEKWDKSGKLGKKGDVRVRLTGDLAIEPCGKSCLACEGADAPWETRPMPMKPHKDETQSEFMTRCVPDLMGPDGDKRPQEQAVAACLQIWRDHKGGKAMQLRNNKQDDEEEILALTDNCPTPESGEGEEEYMDRCIDDLGRDDDVGEAACQWVWDHEGDPEGGNGEEAASGIKHKLHSATVAGMEFILSDETPDRMGEIIHSDGWDLTAFKRNPVALFGHNPDFPIGKWHDLRVDNKSLRGHLELAPEGTSARIDEIRRLIAAGILKAVSVGFRPTKSEPLDPKDAGFFAPQRYLQQELVECSLVSVPANPNALAVAKALAVSPATMDLVFAKHGTRRSTTQRRGFLTGKHARSLRHHGDGKMSLAQRIAEIQARLVERKDKLAAFWQTVDDSNVSDTALQESTDMNAGIMQDEKLLSSLQETERNLARAMDGNGGHVRRAASSTAMTTLPARPNGNGGSSSLGFVVGDNAGTPPVTPRRNKEPDLLDYIVRAGTIAYNAKAHNRSLDEARAKIATEHPSYADDATRMALDIVVRAASAPALTTVTGWAAELVRPDYTDLMPLLMPKAILTRLAAKGLTLNFGSSGRIVIPTRSRTPTIAGSFVGEGLPIPVRQGAFTSQTLTPKKMAVITTWTREMDEHSTPAIEGILREAIQVDTTVAIDSVLIDANAATTVRPAGLLNGVAATTATSGGGIPALVGDIKSLIGAISTATYGNLRSLVWLMNPSDVLSAGLVTAANTGIFPFLDEIRRGTLNNIPIIDSAIVPPKTVILIDAADFVVVGGGAPRMDVSDQATLHMEDTAPAELVAAGSPGVTAAPQRSLFQTDSLALRMVMPLNWAQRRLGTLAWTQSVTW